MQPQVLSREYLQSLPDKRKQQEVEAIIQTFWQSLYQAAENGHTSYFFDMTNMRKVTPDLTYKQVLGKAGNQATQTTLTNDEIVKRFQQKFTGCSVKYAEEWIDSNSSRKTLKRGITIDWS